MSTINDEDTLSFLFCGCNVTFTFQSANEMTAGCYFMYSLSEEYKRGNFVQRGSI